MNLICKKDIEIGRKNESRDNQFLIFKGLNDYSLNTIPAQRIFVSS